MTLTLDLIAAEIAKLGPPVARVAPQSLGYGVDLSCVNDLTATLEEVDPNSPRAVGEAVLRRYITPRGGVVDDLSYGYDVRALCNRGIPLKDIPLIAASMRSEALKDDRVLEALAELRFSLTERSLSVKLTLTLVSTGETFALVFFVTGDGVELQESIDQHG
jgi:hypothetical protein